MRRYLTLVFAFLLTLNTASAEPIGQVASLTPTLRGDAGRLSLGAPVHAGEEITSSASGRGQLLFLDQTTLSIAPNSRITLDRFVYDPDRGVGEVALGLTRGALRFIGGKTTQRQEGVITTPSATIGVRGSSALIWVQNPGRSLAVFLAGEKLCLEVGGARHCTNRKGGVLTNEGYQGRIAPESLAQLLEMIDGPPGPMRPGTRPWTGIEDGAPPDRGPVSTTGEEPDEGAQERDFLRDTLTGILPEPSVNPGDPVAPVDPVDPTDPIDPGGSNCDDPTYVADFYGGDFDLCVLEEGGVPIDPSCALSPSQVLDQAEGLPVARLTCLP
ncbi:FecR family protein [Aliiroseovarius sp.]|uniref:FecR family protein n=1 Tax=Aliiroseovarius sp. TaxID=1872442 RepID=UPI003BADA3CE